MKLGEADAAMNAARAQRRLLGAQRGIVHHRQQLVERRRDATASRTCMPDGAGRGIGVVGDQVAPPDLGRVHADLRRREIDQALGHRTCDGMADGAVLAHHVLVLEHDAGAGAVVRAGVGPADQVDDLVGLDRAGARIDRIGADAGQVVDLERGDVAVALDRRCGALHAVVAGVDVGDEAFQPVGDEFDRPPQQLRQRDRRHLVGIDVHLDAERAADILGR